MARTVQPHINMRTPFRRLGRKGFSLFEMLIVVVLIGLMSLFAFPRVVRVFDQSQVRGARLAVLNKFNAARMNARQSGRQTFLIRSGNVLWIERFPRVTPLGGSPRDTVGGFLNLDARALMGSFMVDAAGFDTVAIDPRGLTQGPGTGPWTLTLTRNAASDVIVISGFGMVTR